MTRITIKDVAREAGVSPALVSIVLNAARKEDGSLDCSISSEKSSKVMETAERLGYKRNKAAASLRSGKSYVIGVITPDISNNTFAQVGYHISNLAHGDGYTVMFGSSEESAERMDEIVDAFLDSNVGGLIVTPCAGCRDALAKAMERGVPVVLINRDIPSLGGVGRVFVDNEKSMRMCVRHLYENGFRSIEMISENMDVSSLRGRERGYEEEMASLGLTTLIHRVGTATQEEEIARIVKTALERGTDALITPRINLTIYALKAIREAGLRIPDDIAIIGHDENILYDMYTPAVSYVSQETEKVGSNAYSLLRRMMDGGEAGRMVLDPVVKFRGSSAKRK